MSAEGLQTNDFKVLKLKETAVENGQYLKIYPQGVLNVCVLIWTTKQSQLNAGHQTLWTRLILEFQLGFYIYFKFLKKETNSGLKMVLKSNWIDHLPWNICFQGHSPDKWAHYL